MNLTGLLQRSVWTHSLEDCQNLSTCISDMFKFVPSLLSVLKLQVWRDDWEVRLLWQCALDRHNEEWFTVVYMLCTHILNRLER